MNEIVNKSSLEEDMPEMNLRQPGFNYSACETFTKTKKEFRISKKQEIQDIFIETN